MKGAVAGVSMLRPVWSVAPNVHAAVTLRDGGVSGAPWATLNLGAHVGDAPAAVAENRRRVRAALKLSAEPLWLNQVHGTTVLDADAADAAGTAPTGGTSGLPTTPVPVAADAAVTREADRVLAVLVADCMPVLFADRAGEVVAAAHAGWRGLAGGVLEATVAAMAVEPSQLRAWLGPAIGPLHFEVGDEVRAAFVAHDGAAALGFARNPRHAQAPLPGRGRWLCDLELLARQRLAALGVGQVTSSGTCTYSDSARCYSFRRDGRTGRMAALIWRS